MSSIIKDYGKEGEEIAVKFLSENGFTILERNFRHGKIGEIDIIAQENDTLVFIEVKTRKNDLFGDPEEAVNLNKQKQIRKIAEIYNYLKRIENTLCRFDVIAILLNEGQPVIRHYKDAF